MTTRLRSLFPRGKHSAPFLYLVGGHDGLLKVGRTTDPDKRLRQHRQDMRENFAWAHLFGPASGHGESRVKRLFAEMGERRGQTEFFRNIRKVDAIAACREQIAESQHERHHNFRSEAALSSSSTASTLAFAQRTKSLTSKRCTAARAHS